MKTITTLIILTINRHRFTQIFYDLETDKNYKHSDLTKKSIIIKRVLTKEYKNKSY